MIQLSLTASNAVSHINALNIEEKQRHGSLSISKALMFTNGNGLTLMVYKTLVSDRTGFCDSFRAVFRLTGTDCSNEKPLRSISTSKHC